MTEQPQETLHQFLDRIWDIHSSIGREMCMPTIVAQNAAGSLFVFKTPWSSNAEKITALALVTLEMQKEGCTRYVFVHEAWMAQYTDENDVEKMGTPSQRDDRIEALIAVAVDRYMDDRFGYYAEIENLRNGKRRLKERKPMNGNGRLYDLFGAGQAVKSRATH